MRTPGRCMDARYCWIGSAHRVVWVRLEDEFVCPVCGGALVAPPVSDMRKRVAIRLGVMAVAAGVLGTGAVFGLVAVGHVAAGVVAGLSADPTATVVLAAARLEPWRLAALPDARRDIVVGMVEARSGQDAAAVLATGRVLPAVAPVSPLPMPFGEAPGPRVWQEAQAPWRRRWPKRVGGVPPTAPAGEPVALAPLDPTLAVLADGAGAGSDAGLAGQGDVAALASGALAAPAGPGFTVVANTAPPQAEAVAPRDQAVAAAAAPAAAATAPGPAIDIPERLASLPAADREVPPAARQAVARALAQAGLDLVTEVPAARVMPAAATAADADAVPVAALLGLAPGKADLLPVPSYPDAYAVAERPGQVEVGCVVTVRGRPAACSVLRARGGARFADAVLEWLAGGSVRYRPRVMAGRVIPESREYRVRFEP